MINISKETNLIIYIKQRDEDFVQFIRRLLKSQKNKRERFFLKDLNLFLNWFQFEIWLSLCESRIVFNLHYDTKMKRISVSNLMREWLF